MDKLDPQTARAVRVDVRRLEAEAQGVDPAAPYPDGTTIARPHQPGREPSRVFNLRLTEEQLTELHAAARRRHLPASTMARAWLLERLGAERSSQ